MATNAVFVGGSGVQADASGRSRRRYDGLSLRKAVRIQLQCGAVRRRDTYRPTGNRRRGKHAHFFHRESSVRKRISFHHPDAGHRFQALVEESAAATEVKTGSAAGSFTLHKNRAKPAVFLAGGIGITPFLSIARQAHHDRLPAQKKRSGRTKKEGFLR